MQTSLARHATTSGFLVDHWAPESEKIKMKLENHNLPRWSPLVFWPTGLHVDCQEGM